MRRHTPEPPVEKGLHPYNTKSMDDRTRQMIVDPSTWPEGRTALPMKKRGGTMEFGFITKAMAERLAHLGGAVTINKEISPKHVRGETFATIDEMLAHGWTVD